MKVCTLVHKEDLIEFFSTKLETPNPLSYIMYYYFRVHIRLWCNTFPCKRFRYERPARSNISKSKTILRNVFRRITTNGFISCHEIFSFDSPPYKKLKGFFNWTMTYRRDSDFYTPYGWIIPKNWEKTDHPPIKPLKWAEYSNGLTGQIWNVICAQKNICFIKVSFISYLK